MRMNRTGRNHTMFKSDTNFINRAKLTTIAMVESRIERAGKIEAERRSYISSRALSPEAFASAARGHWAIENNLHWTLDVTFNEDQSRLRAGRGAKNMAVVRHFALNLVRQVADKRSIKRRRKRAAWDPKYRKRLETCPFPSLFSFPLSRLDLYRQKSLNRSGASSVYRTVC